MKIKSIIPIGRRNVYDITVKDVHHYILGNGVVTHNTAVTYAANQIFVITKSQEKEGTELAGWNFTINVHKSRFVREKSKLPFTVLYEGGLQRYSGLLDIALELGFVKKPSQGWYSHVDQETGEIEPKKYRIKDTNTDEFWAPLLNNKEFQDKITQRYSLHSGDPLMHED